MISLLFALSLAWGSETRFDQLLQMTHQGPMHIPKFTRGLSFDFLCYAKDQPDLPLQLAVDTDGRRVLALDADDEKLASLVYGRSVALMPLRHQFFAGTVLGGSHGPLLFVLGHHQPTDKLMAAIFAHDMISDASRSQCRSQEALEYLCLENVSEF